VLVTRDQRSVSRVRGSRSVVAIGYLPVCIYFLRNRSNLFRPPASTIRRWSGAALACKCVDFVVLLLGTMHCWLLSPRDSAFGVDFNGTRLLLGVDWTGHAFTWVWTCWRGPVHACCFGGAATVPPD
jgi:hypothetical protein